MLQHRFVLEVMMRKARQPLLLAAAAPLPHHIGDSVTAVDNCCIALLHNSSEDTVLKWDGGDWRSDKTGGVDNAAGDGFLRILRVSASRLVAAGPLSGQCAVSP